MTRLECLIGNVLDPCVAEALKLLNTGGSGGSGEPADSFDEVETGIKDANGKMIYKKSFVGSSTPGLYELLDAEMTNANYDMFDCKGYVRDSDGVSYSIGGNITNFQSSVIFRSDGLQLYLGQYLHGGTPYYVTVYYIKK